MKFLQMVAATDNAIADLILVDGDPITDIALIARPQDSFLAIIKGGQLVKGTMAETA
jgi:imidazolonepropionase-like amidohydrolase